MQRVKAHELRQKEEKSLVDELTKFRVSLRSSDSPVEGTLPAQSQQGLSSSPGQACPHKSTLHVLNLRRL